MEGKRILVVRDVISTGESLTALDKACWAAVGSMVGQAGGPLRRAIKLTETISSS